MSHNTVTPVAFQPMRTHRLSVEFKEISIGAAVDVAMTPLTTPELEITKFLRGIISSVNNGPKNPAHWTVQERWLAVAFYLGAVKRQPNIEIGDGRLDDYFDGESDREMQVSPVDVGQVDGDNWQIRHLTGGMAEAIEVLRHEFSGIPDDTYWEWACMAAQLVIEGEDAPSPDGGDGAFEKHLVARMKVFMEYPETAFFELSSAFWGGVQALHHLFHYAFADGGLVIMPKPKGGGDRLLSPARFPARTCLHPRTLEMARRVA